MPINNVDHEYTCADDLIVCQQVEIEQEADYLGKESEWRCGRWIVELGDDGHYKSFDEVYGIETTKEHRPSLQQRVTSNPDHGMPFSPSVQKSKTVKGVLFAENVRKPVLCTLQTNYLNRK
ncbi:uncharacterized protein LOC144617717 [Crassostrea virginica]